MVKWCEMGSMIKADGSLNKEKISWLNQTQTNALIEKLHLNWQQLKVQNSILQGKINGLTVANKTYSKWINQNAEHYSS